MQTGDSNFSLAVLTSPSPSTTSFLDRFLTCAPQLRKKGRGVTKGCYQRVLPKGVTGQGHGPTRVPQGLRQWGLCCTDLVLPMFTISTSSFAIFCTLEDFFFPPSSALSSPALTPSNRLQITSSCPDIRSQVTDAPSR